MKLNYTDLALVIKYLTLDLALVIKYLTLKSYYPVVWGGGGGSTNKTCLLRATRDPKFTLAHSPMLYEYKPHVVRLRERSRHFSRPNKAMKDARKDFPPNR